MSISIDKNTCIGCGACASLCPKSFQLGDDGKAAPISQEGTDCAKNAASNCPVQAITVS